VHENSELTVVYDNYEITLQKQSSPPTHQNTDEIISIPMTQICHIKKDPI